MSVNSYANVSQGVESISLCPLSEISMAQKKSTIQIRLETLLEQEAIQEPGQPGRAPELVELKSRYLLEKKMDDLK